MSDFVLNEVRKGTYLDSVALMRVSRRIAAMPAVKEAALMMATPANRQILSEAGLLAADAAPASGNDLILAVRAITREAADAALAEAKAQLDTPRATTDAGTAAWRPRTLRAALKTAPDANLALISVPGEYAAAEARKALHGGLNVMIFSDNVPLDQERALKEEARSLSRIVMGPDCGTAIINGTPLAFANHVRRGDIGVIGASGTGIQEVTSLISEAGGGISHAIGVGGRDLSQAVGGISTLTAIDALDADTATRRIVLISKPPHPEVARTVLARVANSAKPFTVCFLGADGADLPTNAIFAPTLTAAAEGALGEQRLDSGFVLPPRKSGVSGRLVGLFCGGTLCTEAQLVLTRHGRRVLSNAPAPGSNAIDSAVGGSDRILDLGADEYTRGRPHPMLDPSARDEMVRNVLKEPDIAVVLLDVVIGNGAHVDPAGHVAAVLKESKPDRISVVASVTGTEADPQVRSQQIASLRNAGAHVAPSNALAAELALRLLGV